MQLHVPGHTVDIVQIIFLSWSESDNFSGCLLFSSISPQDIGVISKRLSATAGTAVAGVGEHLH